MTRRGQILLAIILAGAAAAAWWLSHFAKRESDFGYTPNPAGVREFLAELDQPTFSGAAPEVIEGAKGRDTFLYRSAAKAHQALYGVPWTVGRQGIGDCVSWGWAHGVWIAQSVDWQTGRLAKPPPFPLTESIYGGSRVEARGKDGSGRSPVGGYSDGSYGAAAARWVRDWGLIYRTSATDYSPDRAKAWGAYGCGGEGDGGKLDEVAKKHPCKHVVQVKTWDELCAAIDSGYPVTIASSQGFSSQRDEHGFARGQGTWMHQMMVLGTRFAANGSPKDGALVLNSWGPSWVSGPRWPEDQPEGSFWCTRETMQRILGQDDSYAIGSVDGFKHRDLNNANWLMPVPKE